MIQIYLSVIDSQEEKDLFEEIYIKFRKQMLHYAFRLVSNTYDAEDIVHNTFVDIAKNINVFKDKPDKTRYSYLICATRGHAYNYMRKEKNERNAMIDFVNELSFNNMRKSELDSIIGYNDIVNAIKSLDDIYSDVLYLFYVEELTHKEISALLAIKPATVQTRIHRGKNKLTKILNNKDYEQN